MRSRSTTRRLRSLKRWMKGEGFKWSNDTIIFTNDDDDEGYISVRAARNLKEGETVATIPKRACLTVKTTGGREMIESGGLDGCLGLSVAIMYEKSLGESSPWYGYLQSLPERECLPLVWSVEEVDSLLQGTELHKVYHNYYYCYYYYYSTVKEDKQLIYSDWKECIFPLLELGQFNTNPNFFGVEQYFAAKTLVASRSFEIDKYHGFGMVPLADLFNHKTGAEDVHFTSQYESDDDSGNDDDDDSDGNVNNLGDERSTEDCDKNGFVKQNSDVDMDEMVITQDELSDMLEMIMVKDVKAGDEVFNTYGSMGNAALLHRYGFTELDNPYDIVNIDLELVLQWCASLFSDRYSRARLSLWRRLDYTGCITQDTEYFEISFDGEPQLELLILLYIMLLPEDAYHILDVAVSTGGNYQLDTILSGKGNSIMKADGEMSRDLLLTERAGNALLSLADMGESFYNMESIEDEIEALGRCCCHRERKLYHSLVLRVSERKIIDKLRKYASSRLKSSKLR